MVSALWRKTFVPGRPIWLTGVTAVHLNHRTPPDANPVLRSQSAVGHFQHDTKYDFTPPTIPTDPLHVVYRPFRIGKEGSLRRPAKNR
ncbi:MAG: hypothetical protein WAV05_02135 [Anaerolineales bacterium]